MGKRNIPEALRQAARERAQGRCEYCWVHEDDMLFRFEADHIIAEKHGGLTVLNNLAWSCGLCNRYKGTDITSIDPLTGKIAPLYNPRSQRWSRHFTWNGPRIEPKTACGRVTVQLLRLNHTQRITHRLALNAIGRHPR